MDKLEIIINEKINSKIEICSGDIFIHIISESLDLSFKGKHCDQNIIIDNLISYVKTSNNLELDLYSYSTHKFYIYNKITEFLIIENLTITACDNDEDLLNWLNHLNTICCVKNLTIKRSSKIFNLSVLSIINICIKFLENDMIQLIKIKHVVDSTEILKYCEPEFGNLISIKLEEKILVLTKFANKV